MFVFKNFARLLVLILLTAAQFSLYAQKDVTADVKSFKKEAEAEKKKVAEMELKKRNKAKSEEAIKAKAKKDKIKKLQDDLKKINAEIKKQNLDIKSANKNIAKINVDMINQNKKEELDKLSEKKDREAKKIITCNERIKDLRIDAKRINTELESVKDVYEIAEGTLNWSKDYNISNKSKYVNGKWSVHVKARDDRDNYSPEVGVNIIIDPKSDIPLVNVINPLPNAKVLGNLKIVGTAYDDDAVDRVEIIVDNEKEKRAAEGTDFWSYDLDTSMMKDGEHFFRVKVYDINGIPSKEVQVPFQLNRRTPFIEINTIKSGSVVSGKMNVGGIASDDNGIVSVEYSVDDRETFTRIGMIKNLAKNRVKVQWSVGIDSGLLADGTQTVWIRAADKAGSVGYSPLTVIVDHKKPEIWFDFPRDRDKVDGKFTAFGYAYDNVDVKGVEITITGAGMDGKPMPVTLLPGNPLWSYPVDLSKGKSGFYKLTAAVTDVSGNKTVSSVTVSLDEDLDKPKLILKSIANDDRISNSLPLFGDVSDDDGMKEVIVTITKDQAKTPVFQKNIAAKYSFSFDVDASDTSKFTDGKYKVELVPVDINNTKGDLVSVDFWIDRSYPEFDNEFINKNIAGKYFKKVIEVANIQVKKSGALKSVKY
ncbi:MAG TPA: Ig-like domain-containing protein, partial [Spirochaetota bacterium]|nr:Ig-like domain-containing protein [Spirochaetota bacterium]